MVVSTVRVVAGGIVSVVSVRREVMKIVRDRTVVIVRKVV